MTIEVADKFLKIADSKKLEEGSTGEMCEKK